MARFFAMPNLISRDRINFGSDPKRELRSVRAALEMRFLVAAALLLPVLSGVPAQAQLMLHNGSEAAPDSGAPSAAPGANAAAGPAKPKPVALKTPAIDSVIAHDLLRDGAAGMMTLARQGQDVTVARLAFDGEAISKPGELCHVEIDEGLPVPAHFDGRPDGLLRYRVDLQACPFSFDVLEGAVLVPKGQACDFTAADCHVDPAGLWGPQGNTIGAARVHEMERARLHIESDMRANFRVLLSQAGKDKFLVKRIAGEQAGFSSERETLCRSYALESVHGFCALEITRARVLALLAKLGEAADKPDGARPVHKKKPKAPSIAVQPAPVAQ